MTQPPPSASPQGTLGISWEAPFQGRRLPPMPVGTDILRLDGAPLPVKAGAPTPRGSGVDRWRRPFDQRAPPRTPERVTSLGSVLAHPPQPARVQRGNPVREAGGVRRQDMNCRRLVCRPELVRFVQHTSSPVTQTGWAMFWMPRDDKGKETLIAAPLNTAGGHCSIRQTDLESTSSPHSRFPPHRS